MSLYWSTYVQLSEELYNSRASRFRDDNADQWLNLLQISNSNDVLEIGCGSGLFCHKIKKHLPKTHITGIDLDNGHIEYAIQKSKELNLDCKFLAGDATSLAFNDCSFDVCFSYTVMNFCEPNAFINEQYRVLRPGGKIVIVTVVNQYKQFEDWVPNDTCEEKPLFDKIWAEAEKNEISNIKRFETDISKYFSYLQKYSFKGITANSLATVVYCPDSANFNREQAVTQINENRLSELCSVHKAKNLAPSALTENEFNELISMINRRYDKRIEQYDNGEKLWDWRVSTALAINGIK